MQQRSNSDLKVGLTVLIGIIVLILGIGWAKGWHIGGTNRILISFPTAAGLEKGDPVFVRGIKRGTVTDISETPSASILVAVELSEKLPLHKDAAATISMLELMGGKKVEITDGTHGVLDPAKDTVAGNANGDLSSIVSFANSLTGTVTTLAQKVDTILSSVNDLFGNGAFKQKIYTTLDGANAAIAEVKSVISQTRKELSTTLTNIDKIACDASTTITQVTPEVTSTLKSVKEFISRTQSSLDHADSVVSGVNSLLNDARQNQSLLYKLTSDKNFSRQIDSTLQTVNQILRQIRAKGVDINLHLF